MRFRSLQRMKAPTRCPMRPRIGRSRSDVGGDRSPRRWRSVIAVNALDRTPRPCGFSLTIARATGANARSETGSPSLAIGARSPAGRVMHRPDLSGRRSATRARPSGAEPQRFNCGAAHGIHALRSVDPDVRGWRRCCPSRRPHMPFLERPSRQAVFGREINRLLPSMHPLRACATVDPGRSPRLLGFPRGQSALMPRAILSRAASAILPWALWCSLRYVRHAPATVFFESGRRTRALASGRIVCMPLRKPPTPGTAMSMRTCAARIRSWALTNVWR